MSTHDCVLEVFRQPYRRRLHTNQNLCPIDLDRKQECQVNCDAALYSLWKIQHRIYSRHQNSRKWLLHTSSNRHRSTMPSGLDRWKLNGFRSVDFHRDSSISPFPRVQATHCYAIGKKEKSKSKGINSNYNRRYDGQALYSFLCEWAQQKWKQHFSIPKTNWAKNRIESARHLIRSIFGINQGHLHVCVYSHPTFSKYKNE